MKKKFLLTALTGTLLCASLMVGCGNNKKESTATNKDATATASSAIAVVTTPTNTPSPAPTDVPVELPYEETWTYKIVQNGYYNAACTWDENGVLKKGASYEPGSLIYYNDCDEYYNNFVADSNVYGGATLSLDDENAHSSDNSIKITSRKENTKGLSGFALRTGGDNALNINKMQGKTVTIGMWVYYTDSFAMGVPSELTFAVWSNFNQEADKENEKKTEEPKYEETTSEMTAEEKEAVTQANETAKETYNRFHEQEEKANKEGLYKVATKTVAYETWTYIEVTTKIDSLVERPFIVLATLGEKNNDNVTFYNPFYVDDIYIKVIE